MMMPIAISNFIRVYLRNRGLKFLFNGVAGVDPCASAAGHVEEFGEALFLQQTRRRARAITAGANHGGQFVFLEGKWTKTLVETRERRIKRARHVTVDVFARAAHVDDL